MKVRYEWIRGFEGVEPLLDRGRQLVTYTLRSCFEVSVMLDSIIAGEVNVHERGQRHKLTG